MFSTDGKKTNFSQRKCVAFKGIPDEYFDTSPFGDSPSDEEKDDESGEGERHNKENKRIVKKGKKMRVYNIKKFNIELDHLNPEVVKALKIWGPYNYASKFEFCQRLWVRFHCVYFPLTVSENLFSFWTISNVIIEQYGKQAAKGNTNKNKQREMWSTSITADGSKYVGQWFQNSTIKDGIGHLIYPDGSIFEGTFRNDLPVKGRYIMINGDVYQGKMINYIKEKEEQAKKGEEGSPTEDDTNISRKSWEFDDESNK